MLYVFIMFFFTCVIHNYSLSNQQLKMICTVYVNQYIILRKIHALDIIKFFFLMLHRFLINLLIMEKSKFYYCCLPSFFTKINVIAVKTSTGITCESLLFLQSKRKVSHILHSCQISWLHITRRSWWPCIRGWWLLSCARKSKVTRKLHSNNEVNILQSFKIWPF